MKRPAVAPLLIAITLVLTLSLASNVFALNFEFNEDQFPKDKAQREEQRKKIEEKKMAEQKANYIPQQQPPQGMNCMANLNKEDAEKVKVERDKFMKATQDLRQEILSKQLFLQSELVKPLTDIQKATSLQKELSALEADLNQKMLMHLLEVKKISPDAAAACMKKSRGDHAGGCPMMGR